MNKLIYIVIGFILGIITIICIFIDELCGKINWKILKKLWNLLNV